MSTRISFAGTGTCAAQSGVQCSFSARGFRSVSYAAMIEQLRRHYPTPKTVIYIGPHRREGAGLGDLVERHAPVSVSDLRARGFREFDDPVSLQYTSGTTGAPKGATLSHHNILNNGFFIGERPSIYSRDRICLPGTFLSCFGVFWVTWLHLLTKPMFLTFRGFRAEASLRAVQETAVPRSTMCRQCSLLNWSIQPFQSTGSIR